MPCKPAICSHSLGRAWVHDLPSKLDQAARYGLDIELFYEDLLYIVQEFPGGATPENHIKAAHEVRSLCDTRGIKVICLQPFMHYDGLRNREKHAERIEEMKLWIEMAHILGTKLIAVPSTCLPDEHVSGDMDLITQDMLEIADLGAPEGIEFAYEALCWGTHVDTWEQTWEVVCRVNRPNFKICLDTYNFAGRVYADPTRPSGKNPNADADMAASLKRLVSEVDVKKIAFVQVVDAERLSEPLLEGHPFYNPEQCPRMSWSRNCRLFYGEEDRGAYLPIRAILKALIVDLGYEGYLSAELFNRSLTKADSDVPEDHARRAVVSWQKMVADFGIGRKAEAPSTARLSIEQQPRAQL
ncbi:3-dehydroshikimate dehydratase [Fulvia fulva]|uniref:3-dehydroshikimate dehydratase n=1 Tax=Passalora fulva TaxID=5499 RepID=A0A9Q8PCK0_PASFU|nr:3-dehydroshikimate dehydratase [Fulvia fulva]KAK4619874.1 3-dehydroshikimate dehydratase [Fulvia fulva]KAK4620512.1 3-dehydroshikimate dehydratase [Fulvia fulva]UJO20054.1 3-dehydroshikimate dehydratase [Fulvia fulva]WPV17405.1 3-dehydroshikimate dehydratase [Fulvia fulva]WPV32598.1 3-dehydroshikimate dehydratase [Fulvia fulva]